MEEDYWNIFLMMQLQDYFLWKFCYQFKVVAVFQAKETN